MPNEQCAMSNVQSVDWALGIGHWALGFRAPPRYLGGYEPDFVLQTHRRLRHRSEDSRGYNERFATDQTEFVAARSQCGRPGGVEPIHRYLHAFDFSILSRTWTAGGGCGRCGSGSDGRDFAIDRRFQLP